MLQKYGAAVPTKTTITLSLAFGAPYALLWTEPAAGSLQQFRALVALLRDTPIGPTEHKLPSRALTSIPRQLAWKARAVTPRYDTERSCELRVPSPSSDFLNCENKELRV